MSPDAGQSFGFQVVRADADPYPDGRCEQVPDDCWALLLPHQCDEWLISASPDAGAVLAEARRFRAELDAAIAQLEEGSAT